MSINERFEQVIKTLYRGNKRAFAQAIGVSATVIENVVGSRKGKPSYDVLVKICAKWSLQGAKLQFETLYNRQKSWYNQS